ncbi:hypothetical protein SAMN05428997_11814 [Bosea sp. CRIB-10]|nr:hypothetical protein SAMN05428997_11814 [Bosea sp. CRIB-10]
MRRAGSRNIRTARALAGAAACIGTASFAADLPPRPTTPPLPPVPTWTYIAMPYGWLPSINGTTTVRGRSTKIDAPLGEILDRPIPEELFGLMGAFEARNGRFGIMTDLTYMKLGVSDSGARARSVNPDIAGTLAAAVSVQFKMFIAEAALAYELVRWDGATPGTGTSIDLYGGGRFWWQNAEASLALTAGLSIADLTLRRGRALAASGDVTWLDPLVGLRLRHHFSPATELVLRADIGGFGAGSDLSWQAMGYLNWEFARTASTSWSGMLGYRALYVDFSKGRGRSHYEYDMLTHGPVLGLTARF